MLLIINVNIYELSLLNMSEKEKRNMDEPKYKIKNDCIHIIKPLKMHYYHYHATLFLEHLILQIVINI